ncbi:MAG: hypothetical protein KGL39_10430 [Patescibacteria group bacterium]|nr:hypothetical protein [Patescibacteria group bacterium]
MKLCKLFVQVVDKKDQSAEGKRGREFTLAVLNYVRNKVLPKERAMGIRVVVKPITSGQLKNPDVRTALKNQGITQLPALVTGNGVYLGVKNIHALFDRNVRRFDSSRREEADSLERFMRSEMSQRRMDREGDEHAIGDTSDDMMSALSDMTKRREERMARAPRGRHVEPDMDSEPAPRRRTQRAAADPAAGRGAQRADNVGGDDDTRAMIDKLALDSDESSGAPIQPLGGGNRFDMDDGDGDGGGAKDRDMEKAYWENQEQTSI